MILAVTVVLAAGCSGSPGSVAGGESTPPHPANAGDYQFRDDFYFRSGEGGYACGILAPGSRGEKMGAGCHGTTTPIPPRPVDCPEGPGWGNGMQVSAAGEVSFLCTGGVIYASGFSDAPILHTGDALSALGFTCQPVDAGVRCTHDGTAHGFTIQPDRNETF